MVNLWFSLKSQSLGLQEFVVLNAHTSYKGTCGFHFGFGLHRWNSLGFASLSQGYFLDANQSQSQSQSTVVIGGTVSLQANEWEREPNGWNSLGKRTNSGINDSRWMQCRIPKKFWKFVKASLHNLKLCVDFYIVKKLCKNLWTTNWVMYNVQHVECILNSKIPNISKTVRDARKCYPPPHIFVLFSNFLSFKKKFGPNRFTGCWVMQIAHIVHFGGRISRISQKLMKIRENVTPHFRFVFKFPIF